ncbi:hypothetical protein TNCV_2758531 [Trichonephila clavipes]|nr:hypothetical protein TNCV_2758531 [Trichonephila clavipes]
MRPLGLDKVKISVILFRKRGYANKSWLEIYANLQSPKTPKSISDKVPYRSVTKGCKPRLVGKNHNNSSRREDDEPDEGNGQTNEGIWSVVAGLKKLARKKIYHFFRSCCKEYQSLSTRTCGSCTMAHQHIFGLRCVPVVLPPRSPNLNPFDLFPLEIACVCDASGCRGGSHGMHHRRFSCHRQHSGFVLTRRTILRPSVSAVLRTKGPQLRTILVTNTCRHISDAEL